ncbi:MAG TPA: putative quinol monooxygenase [Gammaproteobacteria bacterium]|nr:putative quinol monooxygenase [Gammaproteobacteria bacterium]
MLTIIAKLQVKVGQEQEFVRAMRDIVARVREEPGNHAYAVHQAKDDPGLFMVYEQYADQEALDAHRKHLKEIGGALGELLQGPPSLEFYRQTI